MSLIVLVGAALLITPQFIDWNKYKKQILSQIEAATGFQVDIKGDLDLAVLPTPHVVVNQVVLTHPAEVQPLMSLDQADVYFDIFPLLSGKVSLTSITLTKPEISLRVMKDGSQNWVSPKMTEDAAGADGIKQDDGSSGSGDVAVDRLDIRDGLLSYTDLRTGSAQEISNLNGTFSMKSLQGPYDVAASFDFAGFPFNINAKSEKVDLNLKNAAMNIKAGIKGAEAQFSGVVGFGETPDLQGETSLTIANLQDFLFALNGTPQPDHLSFPVKMAGMLTASSENASYQNLQMGLGNVQMKGSLEAKGLDNYPDRGVLEVSVNLEGDHQAQIKGDLRITKEELDARDLTVSYGTSDFRSHIVWSFPQKSGNRPSLSVTGNSRNLNIDELMAALGGSTGAKSSGGGAAAQDLPKTLKNFSLPFNLAVDVGLDKVIYGQKSYHGIALVGGVSGQRLGLSNVSINNLSGLSASVKGSIANLNALSGIDLQMSAKTKDIEEVLTSLGQEKVLSSVPTKVGPLDVQADLSGVLDNLAFKTNIKALQAETTAKGTIKDVLGTPSFYGMSFGLKHPDLAALLQKLTPGSEKNAALASPVDLSSEIDLKDNIYTLNNLQGSFGPVRLSGSVIANLQAKIPHIKGNIDAGKLPLEAFIGSAKTPAKTGAGGAGASGAGGGMWSKDPIDTTWLNSANVDLEIKAAEITYGGWRFENPSFGFVMKDGTLRLNDWSAGLFGGRSKLNLELSGDSGLNATSALALNNVALQPLVVALAGSPIVQSNGTADFNTTVTTRGSSVAELISTLNGDGDVKGSDITVRGINVADMARALSSTDSIGSQAKALFGTGIKGGASKFETLDGLFKIQNGLVNFSKLDLAGADADIATTGNVSLPAWTIDMKSSVQLHVAEGVEIPPPLEISYRGSLSNPGSSFAQNAIEGYLNRKVSAKVNKLIEKKLGDKLDGQLGGVIGGILGVQPQTQTQPQTQQQPVEEGGTTSSAPANDNTATVPEEPQAAPPAPAPQPKKIEPEDVVKDVLKGFLQ
ncbi:MAG: AsmA family protein [Rhodospirillales bacterium]|nr:AsmA family protein [Rhodospirillales bacterium]